MKIPMRALLFFMLLGAFSISGGCGAAEAGRPEAGRQLPDLSLTMPSAAADRSYLGLGSGSLFKIADVSAGALLVEIMGVYCPRCHEQAPLFGALYARLQRGELKDKFKMVAVAVGATAAEAELVRKQWGIKHPVVPDETFTVHKLLGEPRTPFTIIADRQGRVLYAHEGVIKDMDAFYQKIKSLVP